MRTDEDFSETKGFFFAFFFSSINFNFSIYYSQIRFALCFLDSIFNTISSFQKTYILTFTQLLSSSCSNRFRKRERERVPSIHILQIIETCVYCLVIIIIYIYLSILFFFNISRLLASNHARLLIFTIHIHYLLYYNQSFFLYLFVCLSSIIDQYRKNMMVNKKKRSKHKSPPHLIRFLGVFSSPELHNNTIFFFF